jgi:hypothetical protein
LAQIILPDESLVSDATGDTTVLLESIGIVFVMTVLLKSDGPDRGGDEVELLTEIDGVELGAGGATTV